MPSAIDIVFAVLFSVVVVALAAVYFDQRLKRQLAEGVPDARRNWYRGTLAGEWVITAIALLLWARERRPWVTLGLAPSTGRRLYAGVGLAVGAGSMLLLQAAQVRGLSAERREKLVPKFAGVEFIIPRSASEYRWFMALSVTAGLCEELLYRGFLTWVLASYIGLAAGVLVASVVFGLGHVYQGWKGIVKTGLVGLVMGCIAVASGWLIPAMVIHALIDCSSGTMGFAVFGQRGAEVAVSRPAGGVG